MAEAAVDGMLQAVFVTGEIGEGSGFFAIEDKGARQKIAVVMFRRRDGPQGSVSELLIVHLFGPLAGFGEILKALAIDTGFNG